MTELRTKPTFTFRTSLMQHRFAHAVRISLHRSRNLHTGRSGVPNEPEPGPYICGNRDLRTRRKTFLAFKSRA